MALGFKIQGCLGFRALQCFEVPGASRRVTVFISAKTVHVTRLAATHGLTQLSRMTRNRKSTTDCLPNRFSS